MEDDGNDSDQSCASDRSCASTVIISDSDIHFSTDSDDDTNCSIFPTCDYKESSDIIQEILSHLSTPGPLCPIVIGQYMNPNHLIESDDTLLEYHTICEYRHKLSILTIRLKNEYDSAIQDITLSDIRSTTSSPIIELHNGSFMNFEKNEFNTIIYMPHTYIKHLVSVKFKYIDEISAWVLINEKKWLTYNKIIILNFND